MLGLCAVVAQAATSFLFLLRVRAVYLRWVPATAIFGILWLAVLTVNVTATSLAQLGHFPGGDYCIYLNTSYAFMGWSSIANFVNDTLIFLAITHRLAVDGAAASGRSRSKHTHLLSVFKSKGLHSVSGLLMRSGQLYYL